MTRNVSDRNPSSPSAAGRVRAAVEFKGISHPAVRVVINDAAADAIREAARRGGPVGDEGFEWQPAVIDLGALESGEPDLAALCAMLTELKLHPVAVAGGPETLLQRAAGLKLGWLSALNEGSGRPRPPAAQGAGSAQTAPVTRQEDAARASGVAARRTVAAPAPVPASSGAETLTVQRPVRSGQQIYARNADLIVIGQVSAGAELIADGNIHVYGPLQGRAIAGALGRRDVGIFSLDLQAELVAVGGIYRTFEDGVPREYRGRAVRVELAGESDKLSVRSL